MDGHIENGQKIGNPVLVQGQEDEHYKEMEVELDVSAREMDEYSGRTHQPEADGGGLEFATPFPPGRQADKKSNDQPFADRVNDGPVAKERLETKLPAVAEHRPHESDDDGVERSEPH